MLSNATRDAAVRTPVTENDPLGMFSDAKQRVASGGVTVTSGRGGGSNDTPDVVVSSNASLASSSSAGSDRDVFRQPFSATSTPVRSLFSAGDASKPQRGNSLGAASTGSIGGASGDPGSPVSNFKSLSHSDNLLDRVSHSGDVSAGATSPSRSNTGSSRIGSGGVARSESFMKSMRSVAGGWLSSKFSQIKESTTTTTPAATTPNKQSVQAGA